jgi:hypothetical protein
MPCAYSKHPGYLGLSISQTTLSGDRKGSHEVIESLGRSSPGRVRSNRERHGPSLPAVVSKTKYTYMEGMQSFNGALIYKQGMPLGGNLKKRSAME